MHPYDDEDVLEVRADGLGSEGVSPGLLEHDGHYVVPNVAFPQQLGKAHPTVQRRVLSPDTGPACGSTFTCCLLLGVYGRRVDTWNMIS